MLSIYNAVRIVPDTAKKPILGGRLKGMTDINPMWRIKTLTEQFGPCGIGWYYDILNERLEEGSEGQIIAFTRINLYIKKGEEWSRAIPGTGGSAYISKERNGLYTNDEAFKMALTDALGVACKALGIGADVYYERDNSKYEITGDDQGQKPQQTQQNQNKPGELQYYCSDCGTGIDQRVHGYSTNKLGRALCRSCQQKQR